MHVACLQFYPSRISRLFDSYLPLPLPPEFLCTYLTTCMTVLARTMRSPSTFRPFESL